MRRTLAAAGVVAISATAAASACSSSSGGEAPQADAGPLDVREDVPMPKGEAFCALPGSVVSAADGTTMVVPGGATPDVSWLHVPAGFCAHWFAHVGNPRQIRFAPGGEAFIASPTAATTGGGPGGLAAIVVGADDNRDGVGDAPFGTFLDNLPQTQGLLFTPGWLYYQEGPVIRRVAYAPGQRTASQPGTQIADITAYVSPVHWPKPLDIADDGTLYVGNGSDQGEVCYASRPFVGGILKLDGASSGTPVAKGFRNPISIRCERGHDRCFATEMTLDYSEAAGGREKVVAIAPGDFGFPCCATTDAPFSNAVALGDAGQDTGPPDCSHVLGEVVALHVGRSPIGLEFAPDVWPAPWAGRLLVSLHGEFGTWAGAEVIAIDVDGATGMPAPTSEIGLEAGVRPPHEYGFAAGWDDGKRDHGRPDDMNVSPDGRLFLTNDVSGDIVWIAPVGLVRPGGATDAGPGDSAVGDAPRDANATEVGVMRLLELHGSVPSDAGPVAATVLDAAASFRNASFAHDYDDRNGGASGCVADHFVAGTKPAPRDGDAGSLRITGFAGGTLLDGHAAAEPIVGLRSGAGYYGLVFPSSDGAAMAPFAPSMAPLGSGPISFGTAAGADFGAVIATATPPAGTLTVSEDLTALAYGSSAVMLHPSCTAGCAAGRILARVVARASTDAVSTWPYSRVGVIDCELPGTSSPLLVPAGAVVAMLAGDATLDAVTTSVALVPAVASGASDPSGNLLQVDAGRGVFGISRR